MSTLWSPSRVGTYEGCPQKYKLHYLDKVKVPERPTIETHLGSSVHSALEDLYRQILQAGRVPSLEQVHGFYDSAWEKEWSDAMVIVRAEYSAEDYRRQGRDYLDRYYQKWHPFNQTATIDLEKKVELELADGAEPVKVMGYIDRLARAPDGWYEVHDYKTSRSLPTMAELEADPQLGFYALAVKAMWPDIPGVRLVWHYVAFGETLVVVPTEENLRGVRDRLLARIRAAAAATEFPPNVTRLCDWCEYKVVCPAWIHPLAVDPSRRGDLQVALPDAEDGVKLVDALANLEDKKSALALEQKKLEAQIEPVKEALGAYAEKRRLMALSGTNRQAIVRWYPNAQVPRKDAPARGPLVELVKRLGLWEEVSDLNPIALSKGIEQKKWPADTLAQLASLVPMGRRLWVKLQKAGRDE